MVDRPTLNLKRRWINGYAMYVITKPYIEDEFHFLIQCPLYQEERKKMYAVYDTEIGSINVKSDSEKFIVIMSSKSIKMLISLGNFIVNSMEKKRRFICIHQCKIVNPS